MEALGRLLGALGRLLAVFWESLGEEINVPKASSKNSWILDRFGEGLGRFWDGFWRVWGGFGELWGRSWALLGRSWGAFGRCWDAGAERSEAHERSDH